MKRNKISLTGIMYMGRLVCCLSMYIFLIGCHDESNFTATKERNIVFYIVADNNLYAHADSLLDSLKTIRVPSDANVIAYVDGLDKPCLYKVYDCDLQPIRKYEECNSVSPSTMQSVLNYIERRFPAKENGLVLWSHGTGWINVDIGRQTRAFGQDAGKSINLADLFDVVGNRFDYVIFDACNMSCIETIAEAEGKCSYIVASPYAVPSSGLIQRDATEALLGNGDLRSRLVKVCETYANSYGKTNANISVALCSTSRIGEIMDAVRASPLFESDAETLANLPYFEFRDAKVFFDAKKTFEAVGINTSMLDKIVIYSQNGGKNSTKDCGLSIFVPQPENSVYYKSYDITTWNKRTHWMEHFGIYTK